MDSASSSTTSNGGGGGAPPPSPAPMPSASGATPFLAKTYDMVDDPSTDKIVSWSSTDNSFVVWDSSEFARDLLPKYFKHNKFSSFVRQLNTYGFRKVEPDRWEFANECFLRGQKHLLKNINRRKPAHGHPQHQQQPDGQSSSVGACVEVGKFGLEEEVERLKRDKNVLMHELVKLRQQQQTTDGKLQAMVQRLQGMEQRQQQMMAFLAKAINSPGFLAQFMPQPSDSSQRITEGNKKRRLKQDGVSEFESVGPDRQIIKYQPLMNEAAKAMLRQIVKLGGSSPGSENYGNAHDSFLNDDGLSEPTDVDCGSSVNWVSGVTLQEVPGPTAFITSEVQSPFVGGSDQFSGSDHLVVSGKVVLPVPVSSSNAVIPQLSESGADVMGSKTESGVYLDPSMEVNGGIPIELGGFSPDVNIEWDNSLLDDLEELPGVGDPFWEKFLAHSPPPVESQMDFTPTEENQKESEENEWDKSQNLAELTEQMGLLSSETKKV